MDFTMGDVPGIGPPKAKVTVRHNLCQDDVHGACKLDGTSVCDRPFFLGDAHSWLLLRRNRAVYLKCWRASSIVQTSVIK